VDTLISADNSTAPFVIPEGQVFVLTALFASGAGGSALADLNTFAVIGHDPSPHEGVRVPGKFDRIGAINLSSNRDLSKPFKAGSSLCCDIGGVPNIDGIDECTISGYFTKDK